MYIPDYFEFCCRVNIVAGPRVLEEIPGLLAQKQAQRPMILTDKGVMGAGLVDIVTQAMGEKITIAAKADDGANIFRVEASLDENTDLLRPGMQGIAKINAGQGRLIWIWTHEITDWFRLWLWSWLP